MPNKKGRSGGQGGRRRSGVPGHPARRAGARATRSGPPDFEAEVRAALAEDHPLPLLHHASAMLAAFDPRGRNPFEHSDEPELPPLSELLSALVDAGPATAALARVIGELGGDELLRLRVAREMASHGYRLPVWVENLGAVEVVATEQVTDVLRDSYDVVLHLRVAGADLTAVVLVDFNLGTVVKDAFVRPIDLDEFNEAWGRLASPEQGSIEPLTPADARARIEAAIETGAMTWPPLESDEWPATRPLLEWLLRHLPAGGVGFGRPRWSRSRLERLTGRFLLSEHAPSPENPDDESIVEDLLWYRTDYGYGDPQRWSPTAVEILLLDWYPRKIVADQAYLHRMPDVLRGLVRFTHAKLRLAETLTAGTLAAIDAYEPRYRERLRIDPDALVRPDFRSMAADEVGGEDVLASLDTEPLPDEPFDWAGVPDDLHDRVVEVLRLTDKCCDALLDVEQRTAARRLLRDVATGKPEMFGRGSLVTVAAALCWLVDRANDATGRIPGAELAAHFGVKGLPSTRADGIRDVLGVRHLSPAGPLGSPRYLTAAQRRRVLALGAGGDGSAHDVDDALDGW